MAEPSQRQQLFTAHVPPPRRRNNWIGGGEPVLSHHQPGWTRKGGVRRQSSPMPEPWLTRTWKSDQSDPFLSGQWRETASSFHRDQRSIGRMVMTTTTSTGSCRRPTRVPSKICQALHMPGSKCQAAARVHTQPAQRWAQEVLCLRRAASTHVFAENAFLSVPYTSHIPAPVAISSSSLPRFLARRATAVALCSSGRITC